MKIRLLVSLLGIGILTSANSPKSSDELFGRSLRADHILTKISAANQIIKANGHRYIAIPITGTEVQGWMVEPFACPIEVLRQAVKIELRGLKPHDVSKIYADVAAHNRLVARSHSDRPCRQLGN